MLVKFARMTLDTDQNILMEHWLTEYVAIKKRSDDDADACHGNSEPEPKRLGSSVCFALYSSSINTACYLTLYVFR